MHATIAIVTFLTVIGLIVSDRLNSTVAALLGTLVLIYTGVMSLPQAAEHVAAAVSTLTLILGAMILVRVLQLTQIFNWLAKQLLIASRGKGKRLLIAVVLLTALISSVLPNATAVLLLGPIMLALGGFLGLEAGPLIVLVVLSANTGGMLTLVGDPATYIVSSFAGINFFTYLKSFAPAGIIALLALLAVLPWKWRKLWKQSIRTGDIFQDTPLPHWPVLAVFSIIVCGVLVFFVIGETLPVPISPDVVTMTGATLALFFAERFRLGSVNDILAGIDWNTLLFFACTFVLIGGLQDAGVLATTAELLKGSIESNPFFAKILILWGVALISCITPNIPLLATLAPILQAISPEQSALPLYAALIFGGTLGGNATLLGASANIVGGGIAAQAGQNISFKVFLSYGLPVAIIQLTAITLWLLLYTIR